MFDSVRFPYTRALNLLIFDSILWEESVVIGERVSPSSLLLNEEKTNRSLSSVSLCLSLSLSRVCARAKTEDGGFKRCVDHQSRARSSDRRGGSFFRSNRVRARAKGRKEMPSIPIETSSEPHLSRRRTKRRLENRRPSKKK